MTHAEFHHDEARPVRHSVGTVGLWLFLLALAMLFASSMVGYVLIRVAGPQTVSAQSGPPLHVPALLWVSTLLVLGVSVTLHRAVGSVRRERHVPLRFWLRASMALAIGFLVVQTPAMMQLLGRHAEARTQNLHVYGLIYFLVLLHALHVIGGVIALARVMYHESRGRYDHEHYLPVYHAALYWHFLDVVWMVMFGTFLVVG